MKYLKFKTFSNFVTTFDLGQITKDDLMISDIDGVFFKGIFDPREVLGIINQKNLRALEKLLKTNISCWFLTNRIGLFKHFHYIKQLAKTINKVRTIEPNIYSNCSHFLKDRSQNFAIIMNAKKPKEGSQKVIKKGLNEFKKVIYIGSKDWPWIFVDLDVVKNLNNNGNDLKNLTFIEINPWIRETHKTEE
ncbi:hypothetical protein JW766_02950 [Candidatus Dojkabacteria bacterium]|nr:hypothetical protein [Candidatus Dojkabacteria bacterium]